MTDSDSRRGNLAAEGDLAALALSPEVERALEEGLSLWATEARLPSATLAQIRRAVLADDAAYEPLTPQWWKRVLLGASAAVRATTDVRAFLQPAWGRG